MNIPAATLSEILRAESTALTRLDRVISELRRSGIILVRAGQEAYWISSAETVNETALETFMQLASGEPSLVITGQRASRLGFDVERDATVYCLHGFDVITQTLIERIADPASPLWASEAAAFDLEDVTVTRGGKVAQAVIALSKHAGLLPAVLATKADTSESFDSVLEISSEEIWQGLHEATRQLQVVAQARVPLEDSENTRIVAFRPLDGGSEHLAIIVGEPDLNAPVLIRIHSECYTGDLLGSLRCDCGHQLRGAIALMATAGSGIVLYMAQEGRGIGLINKLRAYKLQDQGRDTVDANLDLGFEEDERDYHGAVQMLRLLGVKQVRLLTNNPRKVDSLTSLGVEVVERVAHIFPANRHNRGYLYTKGSRSGHLFNLTDLEADPNKS